MIQPTADTSLSIKIVTGLVIAIFLGLVAASFFEFTLLVATGLFFLLLMLCYLFAPTRYEISNKKLTVYSRLNKREFYPIEKCSKISAPVSFGVRLWGNGGCFAATGIYWNKTLGKFRAYVTSAKLEDLVLLETINTKIIISPNNPTKFIEAWNSEKHN